jgi:hypothetical protein
METSAKTADNVEDTFMLVAAEIKEKCVRPASSMRCQPL